MVLIKTDGVGAYATPSPKNQTKTNIYSYYYICCTNYLKVVF